MDLDELSQKYQTSVSVDMGTKKKLPKFCTRRGRDGLFNVLFLKGGGKKSYQIITLKFIKNIEREERNSTKTLNWGEYDATKYQME